MRTCMRASRPNTRPVCARSNTRYPPASRTLPGAETATGLGEAIQCDRYTPGAAPAAVDQPQLLFAREDWGDSHWRPGGAEVSPWEGKHGSGRASEGQVTRNAAVECRRFERVPEPTGRLGNFAGQDVAPYVACGTSYRGAFLRWTFSSGGALNSWQKSVEVTQCGGGERAMGEARLADDCSANENVHVDWGILGGTCTVATGVRWESSSLKVVRGEGECMKDG